MQLVVVDVIVRVSLNWLSYLNLSIFVDAYRWRIDFLATLRLRCHGRLSHWSHWSHDSSDRCCRDLLDKGGGLSLTMGWFDDVG